MMAQTGMPAALRSNKDFIPTCSVCRHLSRGFLRLRDLFLHESGDQFHLDCETCWIINRVLEHIDPDWRTKAAEGSDLALNIIPRVRTVDFALLRRPALRIEVFWASGEPLYVIDSL